jgi:aspartyl-tRNA(Asn)/glutamyl-tRNA(Gln) amidotransferase subunit A
MTIAQLTQQYQAGTTTPAAVLKETLAGIREKDNNIKAFLAVYDDATAPEYTPERPLSGVPIAVKNNILVKGRTATAASKMLKDYVAPYSATIVERLEAAGAVIVGATNMDEFAMGSSTENSAFGPTKNPVDPRRVPGGSSGGSAAAVAMGVVPAAIGTDTGGSIRQPASYCGLVGYKPTYGAVSRYGLIAMGSSLDQAGPLTTTVADAEIIHNVMAGHDSMDGTTITDDTYPTVAAKETYTIGVPRDFLADGIDTDVMEQFEAHLAELKAAGHTVVDISLPLFAKGLAAYYISMPAEVSSNLARYDGMRYGHRADGETLLDIYKNSRGSGLGAEVKRRILLGTYVLSAGYYDAFYGKAEAARQLMRDELAEVFTSVDAVVMPTTPTPAFAFGEKSDPIAMYKQDIFTVPVNLTGVPALSFPMGTVERSETALPVGVQYIAPHGGDARLFDIGKRLYDSTLT